VVQGEEEEEEEKLGNKMQFANFKFEFEFSEDDFIIKAQHVGTLRKYAALFHYDVVGILRANAKHQFYKFLNPMETKYQIYYSFVGNNHIKISFQTFNEDGDMLKHLMLTLLACTHTPFASDFRNGLLDN
jgi:hypothetical protein